MKYKKIIRKIRSKLKGNFNENKKLLLSQYEKYEKHPKKEEIYIEIIKVLYDSLDDCLEKKFIGDAIEFRELVYNELSDYEKKEFDKGFSQLVFDSLLDDDVDLNSIDFDKDDINPDFDEDDEFKNEFAQFFADDKEFDNVINQISLDTLSGESKDSSFFIILNLINEVFDCFDHLSKHENIEESFNYLERFFNKADDFFKKDSQVKYHCFNNLIEEHLFKEYFKTIKKLVNISDSYNFAELYYIYGVKLLQYNEVDEAEINLKKALELNPTYVHAISALIELYKTQNDFNSILPLIEKGLKFAYLEEDLAGFYENLGLYHLEKLNFNLAFALFKCSLHYYDNSNLIPIMKEIRKNCKVDDDDFNKVLDRENISSSPNPFILDTLMDLAEEAKSHNEIGDAIYYNKLYRDLTSEKKFRKKISSLKRKLGF